MADANKTAIQVQNQNIGGDNSSFAVLINGAASNTNFSIRTNRTVADSTNSATVTNNIRLGLAGDRSNVVVLDMGGMPVVNMGEPTMSHDAVTLGYLQTNVGTNGPFLPLSGGTVTGATTFGSAIYGINSLLLFSKDSAASERTDILLEDTSIVVEVQDTNEFTFSADGLDMGKHKITDLAAPTQTGDAVNLGYIQTNFGVGPFLPLSGGTMTGNITFAGAAGIYTQSDTDGITMNNANVNILIGGSTKFSVSSQGIGCSNLRVTNVADPVGDMDAVNLQTLNESKGSITNPFILGTLVPLRLGGSIITLTLPVEYATDDYRIWFIGENTWLFYTGNNPNVGQRNFVSSYITWSRENRTYNLVPVSETVDIAFIVLVLKIN